jgi:chorismate synthase
MNASWQAMWVGVWRGGAINALTKRGMNSFGRIFRVSIFGESHGQGIGVCIDGCKAGVALCVEDFRADILRRKSGMLGTTQRIESDVPQILTGIYNGAATGAPLTIIFANDNVRSADYAAHTCHPRPSHADLVAMQKFNGCNDPRGGGHFSGRLTLCLVAAGVVAKKMLPSISINAEIIEIGGMPYGMHGAVLQECVSGGDSLGAVVQCRISGAPVGWGSPFFDSMESVLSHILFAIPGVRGIEFGSGFAAAGMRGSQHNDPIIDERGSTLTNHAGGIVGGISNGNEVVLRLAFKPTASIALEQRTYNFAAGDVEPLRIQGRHDACYALRAPVIVEAACAIALADSAMLAAI